MLLRLRAVVRSSIGRKLVMSLTGFLLVLFVLAHLAGNLTLFADGDGSAFDGYAEGLEKNPLLPVAEIGLALLFLAHIAMGIRTALANREARPARYKELAPHGRRTLASVTMLVTGLMILVFLGVHLTDFRLASRAPQGLAHMVVERLSTPLGAGIYLLGVAALGLHVWHAFQSAFQSLGLNHPRYRPAIVKAGWALALVLGLGFAAFPVVLSLAPESFGRASAETALGPAHGTSTQGSPTEAAPQPDEPGREAVR